VHRHHQGFGLVGQQLGVGQRAGGDHAHHLAFDRPLGGGHVAHLLADGDRFTELDQARQVALDRVEGHAGHDDRLAGRLAALRERDVQQPCGLFRIGIEHLVEVAHAVEQQCVRVPGLEGQVLLHHGGVAVQRGGQGKSGKQCTKATYFSSSGSSPRAAL
jgi:hypothetical protein